MHCFKEKFFHKIHLIWQNKEELGIPDDLMKKIATLKLETKKKLIKDQAEIEILGVDIMGKLWEPQIDSKGLDALIDQKYSLKKERLKTVVNAFISLMKILSDDQKKRLKNLCKESEMKQSPACCSK